ncbi:MAG TPA: ATP-binding protein [Armatimonadota bacterium]|jgi:signal transduction histidine kinase
MTIGKTGPRWGSLRAQLMLWNILALTVMLVIMGVVVRYTVRAWLMASVDRELAERARRIAGQTLRNGQPGRPPEPGLPPRPPVPPGGEGLPDGPPPDPAGPNGLFADAYRPRLANAQGRVIVPRDGGDLWDRDSLRSALSGRPAYSTTQSDGEPIRVITWPLPPDMAPARVVQIPYPLAEVNRVLDGLNGALLLLAPLALLFAGAVGTLVTGRALGPVRRITRTAGAISAQDLSQRLPVTGHDEFADLAVTINGMLGRLELSFSEQDRLVERLRRLVEQQRRFTADASHELRTPLTVIQANASLALGSPASAEEWRQSAEEIDRAAHAAGRLVEDLLLLARADADQLARSRSDLPVRELVKQAADMAAGAGGPSICMDGVDPGLCVYGNEYELVRLFANLLRNAVRYTPKDGAVTVSAIADGPNVAISVADTGPGIAAEHLPHLGERFYRVDPARSRRDGGVGLGLSIAKGIAEAHGGALAFASSLGHGTTVTVKLPAEGKQP